MKTIVVEINGVELKSYKPTYERACIMVFYRYGLTVNQLDQLMDNGEIKILDDLYVKVYETSYDEDIKITKDKATHKAIVNGVEKLFKVSINQDNNLPYISEMREGKDGGFVLHDVNEKTHPNFKHYAYEEIA